jgi:hypothetical protein
VRELAVRFSFGKASGSETSLAQKHCELGYSFDYAAVQVRVRLSRGCGTISCSFRVKFEYSFAVVSCLMRSGSLFDYGGDA